MVEYPEWRDTTDMAVMCPYETSAILTRLLNADVAKIITVRACWDQWILDSKDESKWHAFHYDNQGNWEYGLP